MILWYYTHVLRLVTSLDEIPLGAIRATDPAPVVRHSLHGFAFVAKFAYGSPLSKSGVLNNHWEQDVLADQLLRRAPANALMVDAGMNLGYYTLLARMHGLRTMSIDIQSTLMQYTISSLNLSHLALNASRFVQAGISDQTRLRSFEQHAHAKHQQAFARARHPSADEESLYIASAAPSSHDHATELISSARLDDLVEQWYPHEDVYLLKIDVEGQEIRALRGASLLFEHRRVHHGFIEIGDGPMDPRFLPPGAPRNLTRWQHAGVSVDDAIRSLEALHAWGYVLYVLVQCQAVHSPFVLPTSPLYWRPLADWPRTFIRSEHIGRTPPDLLCAGSNLTERSSRSSRAPVVELIRVVDVAALVRGPMLKCDWNLFFSRHALLSHTSL
jgi:FkbM family methyltransferase